MAQRVMVDTSGIYALLDRSDANHGPAVALLRRLKDEGHGVVVTNFVVAETHALVVARLGPWLARRWLQGLRWPVERVTEEDEMRAREIIFRYQDKDFTYTDATTFAVMERLGIGLVFAFDQHFAQYGFEAYGAGRA